MSTFLRCAKILELSFTFRMLHFKSLCNWSVKSFDMMIELLKDVFPNALFLSSYHAQGDSNAVLGFVTP